MTHTLKMNNIIILDDDEVDAMIVIHNMKPKLRGFNFHTVMSGDELHDLLKTLSPNMIIFDINLGMETGFEVAKDVINTHPYYNVPFIFMTGVIKDSHIPQAECYAPGLILEKPMGKTAGDEFAQRILTHLSISKAA